MHMRPADTTGAHEKKAKAGVTGQPPRAATGALPVTGPAVFVFVRLFKARAHVPSIISDADFTVIIAFD